MDNNKRVGHIPLGIVAGLVTVVVASGGATAWFTWRALNPQAPVADFPSIESPAEDSATNQPATETPAEVPGEATSPNQEPVVQAPAAEVTANVYWLKDDGTRLQLVPESVTIAGDAGPDEQVTAAFNTLLSKAGDPEQEVFTTIPEGTQLLDATVEPDGVHVNLSDEFQYGGGSAAMMGRLGQVIYTATAFDPNASVWISVEGKPLTLLGGEGLEVTQPMTRQDFEENFSL